jgi:probable rRNA maturation factor
LNTATDIEFNTVDVGLPEVFNPEKVKPWISSIAQREGNPIFYLSYVFCSDDFLLSINQDYLNHNYFTDVITFDMSEPGDVLISGEIYISIDRVKENALLHKDPFFNELLRCIAHGLLHLCGYNDSSNQEKVLFRQLEDKYISYYDKRSTWNL